MLTNAITRTAKVGQVADQGNGVVAVQLAVQPSADGKAGGSNATVLLSAAEWNEVAAQAGSTGTGGTANGMGVTLTLTLQ